MTHHGNNHMKNTKRQLFETVTFAQPKWYSILHYCASLITWSSRQKSTILMSNLKK